MPVQALLFALLAVLPHAVEAQPVELFGGTVGEADLLYFAGRPQEAYEVLQRHLEADPHDYDALWRAARAAVMVGMEEEGVERQNHWFDPAIVLGDRAVAERAGGVDGLHWRAAAEGRRAKNAGAGYASELAQRVYDDAHSILALDAAHCAAHNMLGSLSFEVMSLSRFERFLGRRLYDSRVLRESSWEDAERYLSAAVELCPDVVAFQLDLAKLHRKRGRRDEARAAFRRVTELTPVHPPDPTLQDEARGALEELGS